GERETRATSSDWKGAPPRLYRVVHHGGWVQEPTFVDAIESREDWAELPATQARLPLPSGERAGVRGGCGSDNLRSAQKLRCARAAPPVARSCFRVRPGFHL